MPPIATSSSTPLTIADWVEVQRQGDGLARLLSVIEREENAASVTWISLASPDQIQAQWDSLQGFAPDSFPLFGVPFAVKDNIDAAGFLTTAGCPSFCSTPATEDSPVVARLKAAGAILIGKTNLDQFATGLVGTRSPYGAVPNSFDPSRVSGGSSSGSAVVVARGVVAFSLGTDTAGSGRVPAGLNNIVGLKPTRGALSARRVLPACRTLDCVSIFSLTAEDASLVLSVVEGFDSQDAYSRSRPDDVLEVPLTEPTVAICADPPWFGKVEQKEAYEIALNKARSLGWKLVPVDFTKLFALAQLLYEGPWVAERYQAIRDFIETANPEDMDPVVRGIILKAREFSAADAFEAEYQRQDLTRGIELAFAAYDFLLVPTAPAFPTMDDLAREPVKENSQLGTYTNFVNFLDWTALSVPAGFRSDGLPFGVTLIARRWQDYCLLQLGARWLSGEPRLLGATKSLRLEPCLTPISTNRNSAKEKVPIVVVGAHLTGLPLNKDLVERGASLNYSSKTSDNYRLYALNPQGGVRRPGLKRVCSAEETGAKIEVEVWDLPAANVGSFMSTIPHPLGIGSVELEDGTWTLGFICEPKGLQDAKDITEFGGWKSYLASFASKADASDMSPIIMPSRVAAKQITKVLIANRGEIAVRIIRTLRKLGLHSVAIYSDADSTALHVRQADTALSLGPGSVAETYLDSAKILRLAASVSADAVIPGYGFLAENADFATAVEAAGMTWIGPTPDQMRRLGLKHVARTIAAGAGVPVVPGSGGDGDSELLAGLGEALAAAERVGYPVMLKSTAGGGGIGLERCDGPEALARVFDKVQRLAAANFGDGGVFVERFVSRARHVEVQIVGDGAGRVWAAGERDCSLQRRHQKVLEESPAPGLPEAVREGMRKAAMDLAAAVQYRNVGTVEFIYDVEAQAFYFLEVNTRLQVEHTVTESVTGLDLVEVMVRVAEGRVDKIASLAAASNGVVPTAGASVEVRIYAESPLQEFRPQSGRILDVTFPSNVRVDTWVEKGTVVTPLYDPLLAKVIAMGEDRPTALQQLLSALSELRIVGIETNVKYLRGVVASEVVQSADFSTNMLDSLDIPISAVEILDAGLATTVQDYPGRTGLWHVGVPPSGPMDDYSFRLANRAVGNAPDAPALESTLQGPTLRFQTESLAVVTGAHGDVHLDEQLQQSGKPFVARSGQVLRVGKARSGYRFNIAVRGGFDVPSVLGSRSTFELGGFGGHNGRKLHNGDILGIGSMIHPTQEPVAAVPAAPITTTPTPLWHIGVIPGPHGAPDLFTPEGLERLFSDEWTVHYNSNRLGVRLTGPNPSWARETGGEAGLHPSNIHDAPYSVGSVSFTGDEAVVLTRDGPSLGGFVVFCVVASAEMWKLGQVKPGDRLKFQPIPISSAVEAIAQMTQAINSAEPFELVKSDSDVPRGEIISDRRTDIGRGITVRQAGDCAMLLEFGNESVFDLNQSLAIFSFIEAHKKSPIPGVAELTPGVRTLHVIYDKGILPSSMLCALSVHRFEICRRVPSRRFWLPIAFNDSACDKAVSRYATTIRSDAPYLPNNTDFLQQLNGLEEGGVQKILSEAEFLVLGLGDVFLGSPCAVPLDPRHRLFGTKYNPSRSFTPRGAVGIGGQYMCIYGSESPGGYQLVGRTLPIWDDMKLLSEPGQDKPWLFRSFDRISFYPVTEAELEANRSNPAAMIQVDTDAVLDMDEYEAWIAGIQEEVTETAAQRANAISSAPFFNRLLSPPPQQKFVARSTADRQLLGGEQVHAGIAGRCFKCSVSEGDRVEEGEPLLWLESNKMEILISSPCSGVVVSLDVQDGDLVMPTDVLAVIAA
ncbi:uncharacterized protein E0L32_011623 [Thyridium curvatum]|uniref:Urea amidolyase n=1 Tax=Thyridium curvatum TaxID=1093900 RepID=A0A507BP23_9PEZI|nr:uncharacterized protein E0L32_011623 [Thyridium curvatum]TPX18510.1 hypothetical protein E0L32_011623 [Thyridium curvatum]